MVYGTYSLSAQNLRPLILIPIREKWYTSPLLVTYIIRSNNNMLALIHNAITVWRITKPNVADFCLFILQVTGIQLNESSWSISSSVAATHICHIWLLQISQDSGCSFKRKEVGSFCTTMLQLLLPWLHSACWQCAMWWRWATHFYPPDLEPPVFYLFPKEKTNLKGWTLQNTH